MNKALFWEFTQSVLISSYYSPVSKRLLFTFYKRMREAMRLRPMQSANKAKECTGRLRIVCQNLPGKQVIFYNNIWLLQKCIERKLDYIFSFHCSEKSSDLVWRESASEVSLLFVWLIMIQSSALHIVPLMINHE